MAEAADKPVVRASARYLRSSPRKVRQVADQVRGLQIDDLVADDLEIAEIFVDEGPTLRRWRARARGRATRIDRRTCHLSVALTPMDDEE